MRDDMPTCVRPQILSKLLKSETSQEDIMKMRAPRHPIACRTKHRSYERHSALPRVVAVMTRLSLHWAHTQVFSWRRTEIHSDALALSSDRWSVFANPYINSLSIYLHRKTLASVPSRTPKATLAQAQKSVDPTNKYKLHLLSRVIRFNLASKLSQKFGIPVLLSQRGWTDDATSNNVHFVHKAAVSPEDGQRFAPWGRPP